VIKKKGGSKMRKGSVIAILVLIVAAVFLMNSSPTWAQKKGPIKIGFPVPLSGPFVQPGKDMLDGIQLYLEEIGYQVAGRKIELLVEDEESGPATALMKARQLVEKDGVHVMSGLYLGACGLAVAPYVVSKEIPTVFPVVSPDDITQRQRSKWVIRLGWASCQPSHPFGEYAYQILKYKKIAALCADFATGWECLGAFQKTFEENGGKIIQKIWYPMIIQDYSPYLPQLSKEADAWWIMTGGALTIKFFSQIQDFGLLGKVPMIGPGMPTDESTLPSMGDEILGMITPHHYSAALDNPANKKFAKAFRERAKKVPSYYAEACYTGARWIVEGIKAVQGDVENKEKFLAALKKVELKEVPRGPMRLDAYNNVVENIYIRKVERAGGELQNTVIYTYPNVSQFWKYKPEEYLKQPPYSRDYPPSK
jgi:branched-chain amino acid transport system substrate-binding protein